MRTFRGLLYLIAVLLLFSVVGKDCAAQQANRVWSDDTGSYTVEAKMIRTTKDGVRLLKSNGVEINVPFTRLSKVDREHLAKIAAAAAQPNEARTEKVEKRKPAQTAASEKENTKPATSEQSKTPTTTVSSETNLTQPKATSLNQPDGFPNEVSPASLPTITEAESSDSTEPTDPVDVIVDQTPSTQVAEGDGDFGGLLSDERNPKESSPSLSDAVSDSYNVISFGTKRPTFSDGIATGPIKIQIQPQVVESLSAELKEHVKSVLEAETVSDRMEGLRKLYQKWPEDRNEIVISVVTQCLKSKQPNVRKLAIEILGKKDAQESLGFVLTGTKDSDFSVRWLTYEVLEQVGDSRAIDPLVKRLTSTDSQQVISVLASFGSQIEDRIIPLLDSDSENVRLTVCNLLGKIGTELAIPNLRDLALEGASLRVRLQASNAIDQISRRVDKP